MSFAYFIAKRIHFSKGDDSQRVSPPAIRIAVAGIAIGVIVMIISVAIVVGFKQEIRQKVIDFGGHLQILAMSDNKTYENPPICINDSLITAINTVDGIAEIEPFITKPAVLKTDDDFLSVVIKGGDSLLGERDVIISRSIADKMKLKVDDTIRIYFIKSDQNANQFELGPENTSVKVRQLRVDSIYETHFEEYDKQMVFANLDMLQNVNGWDEDMVGGLEINIKDFSKLDDKYYDLIMAVKDLHDRRGTPFYVQTIEQLNPQIFSWLDLLDTNVWVILILMAVVASFTMISGLLIIILERTRMIGIFKAMGCSNYTLRKVFIYIAFFLVGKGLVIGNIIGIALCLLQNYLHIIALDPTNYYLEYVPISINVWHIIAINIGTIIISLFVLIAPSSLVAHIEPTKAIQTE